jgi:hypothetical protein
MRRLGLGFGVVVLLALAGAGTAVAAPGKISATTHSNPHADTTSVGGPCAGVSDNGPVWAYDNLSFKLTATADGPGSYAVTIAANGSFKAFSDPVTGDCASFNGSVDGWYQLEVLSPVAPDGKNLPSQVPGSMGQGAIVAAFFGGNATSINGGSYYYTYNRVDGGKYIQQG